MASSAFRFKKFEVAQEGAAHFVGTDAVLLGTWADVQSVSRFLDIGTGTGVLALMLAQRLAATTGDLSRGKTGRSTWNGIGVEIHPASAALAHRNFSESPWAAGLEVWEGPIQEFQKEIPRTFDLIVSNPPFFSELTISPDKTRSLGRHTATLSPEDLLAGVSRLLAADGKFCVILPELEGRRLCELSVLQGLYWTKVAEVRSRPGKPAERLLIQFEKSPYTFQKETFNIYAGKTGAEYSEVFHEMTRGFYLGEPGNG